MDLKSTQLKDTYGNLLTIGTTAGSPTTGTLENGDGEDITALNVAGTITGVTLTGTLSTAAQANITSVGTLTSLSSTGNINADDYSVGSWKTIDWTGSLVKFGGIDAANWTAISLHTSGSEKVRIDTSGNVGIGTTSPTEKLQIVDSANDVHVRIGSGNAGINPTLRFHGKNTADTTNVYADIRVNPDNQTLGFSGTGTSGGSIEQDALVIDSSGNVGIGTDSPLSKLTVAVNVTDGATTDSIRLVDADDDTTVGTENIIRFGKWINADGSGVSDVASIHAGISQWGATSGLRHGYLSFYTVENGSNTEKVRITDSGNVGIGTTSPSRILHTSGDIVRFDNAGTSAILLLDTTNNEGFRIVTNKDSGAFSIEDMGTATSGAGTERMRIDSSGNVLVAKPSTVTIGTVGHDFGASGYVMHTRASSNVMYLNRTTDDGNIAEFYKDGTTVGSIGAYSGDLWIGQGNTGLLFNDGSDVLRPANASGGNRDGNYDLGASDSRFKDLYLGGSVYLGGTTSANALDDYEEGTFTANLTGTTTNPTTPVTTTGYYTKIGRQVSLSIRFGNVDTTGASGNVNVTGLPYTSAVGNDSTGGISSYSLADFGTAEYLNAYLGASATTIELLGTRSNGTWNSATHNAGTGRYLIINITYFV